MTTPDRLYQHLAAQPDDWATRGVLADWYEEAGEHVPAACLRWMVRRRKRPYTSTNGTFHWFNAPRVTTDNDPESDLPEAVYQFLGEASGLEGVFRTYPSLRAADEDLHAAWRQAREKGWSDDDR
jgi:uncharacterized protein (TIGR02996 family)